MGMQTSRVIPQVCTVTTVAKGTGSEVTFPFLRCGGGHS